MGIIIALSVILLWMLHLTYILAFVRPDVAVPMLYVHILLQAYLYTGLFITSHDSMHGAVSRNKKVNRAIGQAASFLFAALSYRRLFEKHWLHHNDPGTEEDPDYSVKGNFFLWFIRFMRQYLTVRQLIMMAVIFNVLKFWVSTESLIVFWVIPAFLSTLQLFTFGTYIPHRRPHSEDMKPHNARTLRKNHLWAMLSCYFFGYHYEHHQSPSTPWWQMYRLK